MSKLNPKNTNTNRYKGVSFNGNVQELKGAEQALYDIIVTTLFGKDKFYESNDDTLVRLKEAVYNVVGKGNIDFIANSIVHARSAMNIRSMPLILTVLLAEALRSQNTSYDNMRRVTCDVIQRADQINDLFAYAVTVFGSAKKIPMAIKRGLADAFNKFGAYNFAKYNRANGAVKFTDVLRVVHPTPKDAEHAAIFDKLMNEARTEPSKAGKLETPYTWETELSEAGKTGKSKAKVWTELINSNKLGYMALLRNLRNMNQEQVSSAVMNTVFERLVDPEQVKRSKQLPFRFVSAYDAVIESNSKMKRAISRAMDASLSNIPVLGDNVWIVVDVSASMGGTWGMRDSSGTLPIKTATLFAAALAKANADADNVVVTLFSDNAKNASINTDDSVMSIADKLRKEVYGGGTNLSAALNNMKTLGFKPDTVVLLSDMQVNHLSGSQSVASYFDADTVKVAIDLNGYTSTPAGQMDGWHQLSGWSERLFDFIPALRNKSSVVKELSVPYIGVEGIKERHGL